VLNDRDILDDLKRNLKTKFFGRLPVA